MKLGKYVPERGDVVWLDFSPQKGAEIKKVRPALTLSPKTYNKKTNLGIFVPITSSEKGYPFEVEVEVDNPLLKGMILCDQVKNLDWAYRNAKYITALKPAIVTEVLEKLSLLLK